MKLATFRVPPDPTVHFGGVVHERVLSFKVLQKKENKENPHLADMTSYLRHLPASEQAARELLEGSGHPLSGLKESEMPRVERVKFLPPVPEPAALIDFALSPRHLGNSLKTLLKYECPGWSRWLVEGFIRRGMRKRIKTGVLPYYKGNHHTLIGDGEEAWWPAYTAYLDIEAELAFVTGNAQVPIAGYTIFNDWSARDVQWPEMFGLGLSRSKDFDRGNGMGPFLVTPEEVGDPLALGVTVGIGARAVWKGSTSEYARHPREVLAYLRTIFSPGPGTIVGMGAVPDCTGLDRDEWIQPGDRVEITLQGIGTLRQVVPEKKSDSVPSRWKKRKSRDLARCNLSHL